MMRFLSYFWLLPVILLGNILFIIPIYAQPGGYDGSSLREGTGVRAQGMGGAFVGLTGEVSVIYCNPAGLARIDASQFGVMWSVLTLDRNFNYSALAIPLSKYGTFAVSWVQYRVGNIEARDKTGALFDRFSNTENTLFLSYGVRVQDYLSVGLTSKIYIHNLYHNTAKGKGFDIGLQVKPSDIMNIGLSIQNIFNSVTWDTETEREEWFGQIVRLGLRLIPKKNINLYIDFEIYNPPGYDWKNPDNLYGQWHIGAERLLGNGLMIRGGLNDGRLTLGASYILKTKSTYEFQYAFSQDPFGFGSIHTFGFLFSYKNLKKNSQPSEK